MRHEVQEGEGPRLLDQNPAGARDLTGCPREDDSPGTSRLYFGGFGGGSAQGEERMHQDWLHHHDLPGWKVPRAPDQEALAEHLCQEPWSA